MPDSKPVTQESRSSEIQVERDGVRIGWKLLAAISTVGLAAYVATYVAPLESRINSLERDLSRFEETVSSNSLTIQSALKQLTDLNMNNEIMHGRFMQQNARMLDLLDTGPKGQKGFDKNPYGDTK